MKDHPPAFLTYALGRTGLDLIPNAQNHRPQVTLTFAQSLDGKIAGSGGKQLSLSGEESMIMTHWMRTMHDVILIGIGTALNDNPQLNVRLLPQASQSGFYHIPRPVILDSNLRLDTECKLLKNYKGGNGRRPWVFCAQLSSGSPERKMRKRALEEAGASVFEIPAAVTGHLSIPALLEQLHALGTRSIMVEGGAKVIGSFLSNSQKSDAAGLVDVLIVTVAPIMVGNEGVGYEANTNEGHAPLIQHIRTELMGKDTVIAGKLN
ncbi:hypothetical protein SERLA73DRAFT_186910 [Serpula lacrymans var. lacrymans S7.3]|uniref:2,5-diamino-6-ribosylamino-4(3H)-pyrimidinone 5'-phosphate reductase n=2 Tax=Serpula lacrymans var. lacrymans TaxID=341189 RepID=F8Q835_SERL3|nr:uncharacterized protein SERLADRAFT_476194 [Serpula lacrymans var. lacrymans S7.9]EGN95723.1 hypothetical protein SERLA73DRAFT_186910 [Serpula lacrymans var. lacrymans S7.3]EGO21247.1 hypothetical protein SERLADRAFT_476194 [Serpula lacrymans var. lacrymans S7.9]